MSNETKPQYVGLWTKEDKNGNPYLNGSTDEIVYFIFRDRDDVNKKVLYTLPKGVEGAKLTRLGDLTKGSNDNGEYIRYDNMFIFPNTRREKENHPHFNLVIFNKEA